MAECSKRRVALIRTKSEAEDEKGSGVKRYHGSSLVHKVYDDMVALHGKNNAVAWDAMQGVVKSEALKTIEEESNRSSNWNVCCYKIEEKGIKQIIQIPPSEALPPMNFWTETHVNIPTPDSKYLSHLPFMGDGKRKRKDVFSEELLEMYDGKLHADNDLKLSDFINMLDFIRVLMEVNQKYGDTVFSEKHIETEKPSAQILREIYDYVLKADEKVYLSRKPSINLITTICNSKFPEVDPNDLMKRYDQLSECRNSEFNKVHNPPKNVDVTAGKEEVYSKAAQMDSYRSMFCRICFKYACVEHTLMMSKDEISTMQSVVKLQREKDSKQKSSKGIKYAATSTRKKYTPRRAQNGTCQFKDYCYKNDASPEDISSLPAHEAQATWKEILSKWAPTERTMFNCHYESLGDYCIVASLLYNKTCREVMNYHKFSQLMSTNEHNMFGGKETDPADTLSSPDAEVASCTLGSSGYESASASPSDVSATTVLQEEECGLHELCSFIPCCHSNGICDEQCICVVGKTFCEASCGCLKSCKNRFKGCVCLTTCDSKRCPCYIANRECDPDLCKNCGSHEVDIRKVKCKNVAVQRRLKKPIYVAKSTVSGLGAFAGVDIIKGEFIEEYTAEMISSVEADRRGYVYDERQHTFLFDLSDKLVLDASRLGSKSRFINSSKQPNCEPIKMIVRGEKRLTIRAIKDIEKDEELFFNYHEILVRNKTSKNKTKRTKKYVSE